MTGQAGQISELPAKYYLDNFHSLLEFVEDKYQPILGLAELAFIQAFRSLSENAQCLYLRFANRKGLYFRLSKLEYPEIDNITAALDELFLKGFCRQLNGQHAHLIAELLRVFSKAELSAICRQLHPPLRGISKYKKEELAQLMLQQVAESELLPAILETDRVVGQHYADEFEMLKFLFFGHLHGQMSDFVIRDLGLVRFEQPEASKLVAKFSCWQEAEEQFWVSAMYEKFRELREGCPPEKLYAWFMQLAGRGQQLGQLARPTFDRLCRKLGRMLERQQQSDFALEVYRFTQVPPSRERQVRILHKRGELQRAFSLSRQILEQPQSSEEAIFAQDYLHKQENKKATRSTTRWLKGCTEIEICGSYKYAVEAGVLDYYQQQGFKGLHSENYLFRSLFGLLFWDIIFDQDAQVYHSPLQRFPSDLYLPQFLLRRKEKLEQRINELNKPNKLRRHMEACYDAKWGLGNPLVSWHENTLPLLKAACRHLPPPALGATLLEMAKNLKEYGRGFPDIFIWNKSEYKLIEVKSPTDALSPQQLYWLQFFKDQGIKAEVQRVRWKTD